MVSDDFALLDRWREGDAWAGNQLFERHFASVYRFFAHKVGGESDVADLAQRTFLGCVEAVHRFRGDASFRTFLFGIARNELFQHFRRRRRQPELDVGGSSIADLGPSPSTVMRQNADERVLLEALRSISLDAQIILELHYWEELTGPELAAVLDVPEGTVRSRLQRARESLRRRLQELTSSSDPLASTIQNLDEWSRSLKAIMAEAAQR
jgi:RNA polymerase sigma factor (sigma-70 family)